MYALVANGIQTICKDYRQLQALTALYPYPKFQKCNSMEEGRKWLRANARRVHSVAFENYGDTAVAGYICIAYEIREQGVAYDLDLRLVGYVKIHAEDGMLIDSRKDSIHIEVNDVELKNELIVHHIIAIKRILRVLGEFVDVNIIVPDISVYLAVTKYTGRNHMIRGLQSDIERRIGAVAVTVREVR